MAARFRFSLRVLAIILVLGPAFFFSGMHFERARFRRVVEAFNAEIQKAARELEAQSAQPRFGVRAVENPAE